MRSYAATHVFVDRRSTAVNAVAAMTPTHCWKGLSSRMRLLLPSNNSSGERHVRFYVVAALRIRLCRGIARTKCIVQSKTPDILPISLILTKRDAKFV